MDTSSSAAAAAVESTSATIHVKHEPGTGGQHMASSGTGGGSERIVRKMTVLDPLKLKLLARQNQDQLLSGLRADYELAVPVIKTEPVDAQETQMESVPYEAYEQSSGRLLSIVSVPENRTTAPCIPYSSRDMMQAAAFNLSQTTPMVSFNYHASQATSSTAEHVFATPEPVRAEKRKRRTKQQIEADKQAKLQEKQMHARSQRVLRDPIVTPPIVPEAVVTTMEDYLCANCGQCIPKAEWQAHYAFHSGLTYRAQIDQEINLFDESVAVAIVTRFMKTHRQITVQCDKCGVSKKSALGLVSHRVICGLTPEQVEQSKVTCEYCKRKMLAVSVTTHLASHCSVLKKMKQAQAAEACQERLAAEAAEVEQVNQLGRIKRRATARAEKKIQTMSCEDLITTVTKASVSNGCLAAWKTQFRKAKLARCIFPTCDFTGYTEVEMRHHHEFCPLPCELYECKNCRFQSIKIESVTKHITIKHPDAVMNAAESSGTDAKIGSESSDDEGTSGVDENEIPGQGSEGFEDDSSTEGSAKKRRAKKSKPASSKSFANQPYSTSREMFGEESDVYRDMVLNELIELRTAGRGQFHTVARKWTVAFRQKNYTSAPLYPELRPEMEARFLAHNTAFEYIPKRTKSLRFYARFTNVYNTPIQSSDHEKNWQQLDAFTGRNIGNESLFFCGGPVIALDWLPMANERTDGTEHQILAVACKNDFNDFYLADRIAPSKCLIQIWDVGCLKNESIVKKGPISQPTLLYSIACDFGPIWALKFCPSGCFNSVAAGDQYDRLGLLAATGADGDVYIYSLRGSYSSPESHGISIISLKPVLRLTLCINSELPIPDYECHGAVKLSWSRSKNHAIIAAGYSNGVVAIWNLNTKSPLLTGVKEGCQSLLPVQRVFIPDSCITTVDIHFTEGGRYLLVSNADRKVLVFDLHTGYLPTEVCSVNTRSKVTTACWNAHFPVIAMAFDDVYAADRCALTLHQPREIGMRLCPIYSFTAEATHMSSSEWLSNHLVGTDGGDVLCHQPMPFVYYIPPKHHAQQKYILSYTTSVKLSEGPVGTTYDSFHNNFGLLFSDLDKAIHVKTYRRAQLQEYPGIRVNQVLWNPNERAHHYYAIGYQAGFVRIRGFRLQ